MIIEAARAALIIIFIGWSNLYIYFTICLIPFAYKSNLQCQFVIEQNLKILPVKLIFESLQVVCSRVVFLYIKGCSGPWFLL